MMNSLYKKIALVCVISITANQAVHAVQFPNVWNLMKGNPKTTAGIITGVVALAAVMMTMKRIFKNTKRTIYVTGNTIPTREDQVSGATYVPVSLNNKQAGFPSFTTLKKQLDDLTKMAEMLTRDMNTRPGQRLVTLTADGKVVGCLSYNESDSIISVETMVTGSSNGILKKRSVVRAVQKARDNHMKKHMLEPVLKSRKDIVVPQIEHDFVEQQITAFDGVKPKYEEGVFKRAEARYKTKHQKSLANLDKLSAQVN